MRSYVHTPFAMLALAAADKAGAAATPKPVAAAAPPAAERTFSTVVGILGGITPPARAAKNARSKYPFDTLEIGQCFGVKGKKADEMTSVIGSANRKHQVPQKDAAGNILRNPVQKKTKEKDAAGNPVMQTIMQPVMIPTRKFVAYDVAGTELEAQIKGTPLDGSDVLVFRVALPTVAA